MSANVFDTLKSRGFLYQCTDEDGLRDLLGKESVTCYIGFDPTAESLHVGSLVPLMALRHMKRAGHRVILLCGGGTAMVGDPSGKQEMRPMMSEEEIESNTSDIFSQLIGIVENNVEGHEGLSLNNRDWLLDLRYIRFLRDTGRHMSVNRMLARESARRRFESKEGLSFLEFNYACLQAFDFLHLFKEHGCLLQMGGQDQWGNICEGIDLIARPELAGGKAFGLTFPLLKTSSGEKFGKTADGAVWLDARRTPAFDYYQFWRNCEDGEVEGYLLLFTELDADVVRKESGKNVNRSKEILAYECTKLVHGSQVAAEVFRTAVSEYRAADPDGGFTLGSDIPGAGESTESSVPTVTVSMPADDSSVQRLLVLAGLCKSKGEARRLLEQGGVYAEGVRVRDARAAVGDLNLQKGELLVSIGKKRKRKVILED